MSSETAKRERHRAVGVHKAKGGKRKIADIPPFSMPLTAASDTLRSTFLAVSLAESRTEARNGEVEKKRVWRAKGRIRARARDMVALQD